MTLSKPLKRTLLLLTGGAVLILLLVYGFRGSPLLVDSATAVQGEFRVTLEEEGRSRVAQRYQVSAPVTGHIARVLLEPGDAINPGDTLFVINPLPSPPLDSRSHAQAQTLLSRADAALLAAQSQVEAARAEQELAEREFERVQALVAADHLPREALDRSQSALRQATAYLRSAEFTVDVARHERDNAKVTLAAGNGDQPPSPLRITSPVQGTVLTRLRQSEGVVPAGEPVLALGNLDSLEIEVDVLSPDAVRLSPGMAVEIERWGGEQTLPGRVKRIEPAGFTRISALGVEEQRVWVIVALDNERETWQNLGDGYRVEARFILWQGEEVLQVPASALFREEDRWGLFVVEDSRARYRSVTPGRSSGLTREILSGVTAGERIILHPGQDLQEGNRVRLR